MDKNPKYPYVPAAFQSDQKNSSRFNDYQEYYNQKENPGSKRGGGFIKTIRSLDEGINGKLPEKVKDVLTFYQPEGGEFFRKGIIHQGNPNSLLACVMYAVGVEDNLIQERLDLAEKTNPDLLRQELYDMTFDEIALNLKDPKVFLDPNLYYRAVEEFYKINLFVFSIDANDIGTIEEPRNLYFSTRVVRPERKTVLIFRNPGLKSEKLPFPHCELIMEDNHTKTMKWFGADMALHCKELLLRKSAVLTWTYENMDLYENFYDVIDINKFIISWKGELYSQYIDSNGKMRGFTILIGNSEKVTIAIPPHQPMHVRHSNTLYSTTGARAIELMGTNPSARTVGGLWFEHCGFEYGIHVIIQDIDKYSDLKSNLGVPLDPLSTSSSNLAVNNMGSPVGALGEVTSITGFITKTKRTLFYIKSLLTWLYDLYKRSDPSGNSTSFANKYIKFEGVPEDNFYEVAHIEEALPKVKNVEQGMDYVATVIPNMIDLNTHEIIFHNENFAQGLTAILKKHRFDKVGTRIENYYQRIDGFKKYKDVEIYIGKDWRKELLSSLVTSNIISKHLKYEMKDILEPILYYSDETVYIIQNTRSGALDRALSIGFDWHNTGRNFGPNVLPLVDIAQEPHFIYEIGPAETLVPVQDVTNNEPGIFFEVVNYSKPNSPPRYGAMLRIA